MADSNNAKIDGNYVKSALGVSSVDQTTTVPFQVNPSTGRLLTDSASASGTVTSVSVVSANGFAGTVANATTTPAITLTTTNTTGSVLFASANTLGQDNANFFWDSTNHRLGIGTATPAQSLDVEKSDVHFGIGPALTPNSFVGGVGVEVVGTLNTTGGVNLILSNKSAGTSAFGDLFLQNDLADSSLLHYAVLNYNSSTYNDTTFGTAVAVGSQLSLYGTDGPTMIGSAKAGSYMNIIIGGLATTNEVARWASTGLTVGLAGTLTGKISFAGATSGATALTASVTGSGTLTLPAATDTIAVLALAQAFTNKTYNSLTITNNGGGTLSIATASTLATTGSNTITLAGAGTAVYTMPGATTTLVGTDSTQGLTNKTYNGMTITASTGTFTLTNAKTFAVTNTITLSGTDSTVMTFPTTSKTIAANDGSNWTFASQAIGDIVYASSTTAFTRLAAVAVGQVLSSAGTTTAPAWSSAPQITTIELGNASDTTLSRSGAGVLAVEGVVIPSISSTNTFTNKFITPQVQSVADAGGTFTPVSITNDMGIMTALSQATTIAAPTGSPVQGEKLIIRIKDNGTARALTWNAIYRASSDLALPTTTILSKTLYCGFIYNSTDTKWDLVAYLNNF